ncbi:MAG: MJ0042-type zinc finger domain-containing protein [Pseudomonadota bacterium]
MHIVCPHCTTSYAVNPANFGEAGRRVRCSRCHEVWQAMPQEMAAAAATSGREEAADPHNATDFQPNDVAATGGWQNDHAPHIESPPIAAEWTEPQTKEPAGGTDQHWPSLAERNEALAAAEPKYESRFGRLRQPVASFLKPSSWAAALPGAMNLTVVCAVLGAMVFALIAWRADVVRVMPQTAAFFKMAGMGVNLRGLAFEDVKISTEIVNNKPVLLIEGAIIDVTRRPVEIPRLRFIVRDANGSDVYAWNAVLEQPVLNPGEKAWFKTRLASPPAEGRAIAVRFFHKQDIASGGT